ncbi:unnamed protein product [Chondrus crispus]|uniref:Uncharacterized protein n=1 Tax=Chondrus crispus TaxID=2769 RepID=R7Q3J2_CHOCR|nr:unnamed protein product [Chondrus crispus]CDF32579.1 unnamed protein product [Chondrus crispus]|eukprot:XP_005712244.1 unnamed protein product [Chondrus crispus]
MLSQGGPLGSGKCAARRRQGRWRRRWTAWYGLGGGEHGIGRAMGDDGTSDECAGGTTVRDDYAIEFAPATSTFLRNCKK